ncbi:M14 family metallopeptidase [Domibacillus antri]|nr:M14 family metallocarboxypeptidase [Domibacillus antri]
MKKWIFVLLVVMLTVSSVKPALSNAETAVFMTTTSDTVIESAGSDEQSIITTPIPAGTNVLVIQDNSEKVKVEWNGINGFIDRSFLTDTAVIQGEAETKPEETETQPDIPEKEAEEPPLTSGNYFQLKTDTELYEKRDGKMVKIGRLLAGEVWKKKGVENGYISFILGTSTGYVKESEISYLRTADLAGGIQAGKAYKNKAQTKKTAELLYSKNGQLTAMARIVPGFTFETRASYGSYYIISIGGRSAYIRKSDVTLYTGNYIDPFKTITYSQMVKDLKELVQWHPEIASLESIGKSVDGRELYALKLGTGKEEVLVNASHHAREHMTTNVVMEMADQYAHLYKTNGRMNGYSVQSILKKTSIYFVPMVNPDGVSLVQLGAKSAKNKAAVIKINGGKTNFSAWKANVRGVDLNRQYPATWSTICCNPGKPSPQNYKGPKALSEPEAKAMYDFTLKHSFKASAAYHSSGQIIFWHFHQSGARKTRDYTIAKKISNKTGYSLVAPRSNPSGGGYTDWFIQNEKKPGLTIEISPYVGNRPVPIIYFSSIWKQNNTIGILLANETIK